MNDSDRLDLLECLLRKGIVPRESTNGSSIKLGVEFDGIYIQETSLRVLLDELYIMQWQKNQQVTPITGEKNI